MMCQAPGQWSLPILSMVQNLWGWLVLGIDLLKSLLIYSMGQTDRIEYFPGIEELTQHLFLVLSVGKVRFRNRSGSAFGQLLSFSNPEPEAEPEARISDNLPASIHLVPLAIGTELENVATSVGKVTHEILFKAHWGALENGFKSWNNSRVKIRTRDVFSASKIGHPEAAEFL
ncbi:hypothetical protein B0H10DRAFT_2192079 [Mycena sp. CBHHK59/15]|nr:hypothetical protein B0H10DRAFT_2192079 [Mycena sp. CBHHK59/15]